MNVEWKKMKAPFSKYEISSDGRVRSLRTNRLLKGNTVSGYQRFALRDEALHKTVYKMAHRLVAEFFLESYAEHLVVNHKNFDRMDNRAENLECITTLENIKHARGAKTWAPPGTRPVLQMNLDGQLIKRWPSLIAIGREAGFSRSKIIDVCKGRRRSFLGFIWRYDEERRPADEIWRDFSLDGRNIGVSSYGAVRGQTGKILKPADANGYVKVNLSGRRFLVHRLVALVFLGPAPNKAAQVNHKNFVKTDNRPENLEWVSPSENSSRRSPERNIDGLYRRVIRIDIKTGEETSYKSLEEAVLKNELSSKGNLCEVCNGRRKTTGGFGWKYADY